ncbi:Alcohol dehydrogenase 2 [Cytospora mali]|uniref:alcohol dehydrogenase n=1 Tax=Cytospora mali TaxID=578113 RepID=A0A194VPX2_CYTMA|nr:Alcohol dehydrogenase 2 [Valsa mali]
MTIINDTYKAAVVTEIGAPPRIEIKSLPKPQPGPNEVLVRLNLTSLCGSDCSQAAGHLGPTKQVLGHEGVGRIESLGSNAAALDPTIEVGQRVGVAWTRDFCGSCAFCTNTARDGETRCAEKPHSGAAVDGTFAQYTVVPARYVLRIPEDQFGDVADEVVAPVLCGGVTAYKAIKSCDGLTPGQWIAVCGGGGGVGAFAVAFGKAMGYRVIATDAGAEKGGYTLEGGAEHYIDVTAPEVQAAGVGEEVKKLTGGLGASAVFVCTGVPAAYQSALDMLAPFGTLMCVGIPPPAGVFAIHPLMCIGLGWRIMGSSVGTRRDTLEALDFVKRGLVKPKVQWAELERLSELMEDVSKGKVQGKYVINLDKA